MVIGMKVDRDAAERAAPFHHCCIEVRMRYTDSLQATEPIDQGDGCRVQHRNAVPQTFPLGVQTTSARWPMAKGGCVPMPITPGSYWRYELKCPAARAASVVQVCPRGGTYCRSSSQIAQCCGGALLGVYWVPQAVQMVHPALSPTKAPRPPSGDIWLHEIKHHGFGVAPCVKLYSRPRTCDVIAPPQRLEETHEAKRERARHSSNHGGLRREKGER